MKKHEKLAAGGAKPPLSLSMCMDCFPHPSGWQHVPIASVWPLGIVELYDVSHQSPRVFKIMRTFIL